MLFRDGLVGTEGNGVVLLALLVLLVLLTLVVEVLD